MIVCEVYSASTYLERHARSGLRLVICLKPHIPNFHPGSFLIEKRIILAAIKLGQEVQPHPSELARKQLPFGQSWELDILSTEIFPA